MADITTGDATTNVSGQYDQIKAMMLETQIAQAEFNAYAQQISAATTAAQTATNLVMSTHQAGANSAKSIGQNMVDSSRR